MIKFKYETPVTSKSRIKATAQRTGKLGFSSAAAEFMKLNTSTFYRVGTNAEDPDDNNLYLVVAAENDIQAFKVNKAGKYFYMSLKHVFDKNNIEYENERTIFDIKRMTEGEIKYYELKKREPINRSK